ncbi:MAG: 2-oxoglutarate dehydrogenase complex dihydrolipoyllysine-residue succinyltransferase [Planctomycetota bacterium]|jgi:2-oxoglutarate dehydrogenase E2 component (dihydrolipoamide succinyltransferase)
MTVAIVIPSPGESITDVTVGPWHKASGDWVEKDETVVEIESDKVTLEVAAPESGVLAIAAREGEEKTVGETIGSIDPAAERVAAAPPDPPAAAPVAAPSVSSASTVEVATETAAATAGDGVRATSLARKIAADKGVALGAVHGTGTAGRVTKSDVLAATVTPVAAHTPAAPVSVPGDDGAITMPATRGVRREKMSRLRQRIAERLVMAQHTAAMLTTFNEADMTEVIRLRKQHKESFEQRHGVGLGFMSFFVKASVAALQAFPRVNAYIVGDEVEYHDYVDVSVAVGTDKGLVVPVIRNAEQLSFADVERTIRDFAGRAREGRLGLDEMTGGTFTLSNGGVYGSLNSTPILNPPQSAILGMHKIMNRAVEDPANPGQLALRPMMYLALSYDHRMVDGAEAVGFLVHIKNCLESPERMLLGL